MEWENSFYTKYIVLDRLGFINKEYSSELLDVKLNQKWKREYFVFVEILPNPVQDREIFGKKHPENDPEITNLF